MKAYSGSRGSAPLILTPVTRWRKEMNITLPPFYYMEKNPHLLKRRLGSSDSLSGRFGEEFLAYAGI
jgi:hypothetical protein